MRVLVISDVHGNAPALEAVLAEPHDVLVCVGHTHLQFQLAVAGRTLVNPGSVGQPKDGDPRAAYALLEDGTIRLRRVAYPVERTVAALERSGVDPQAVATLSDLLRTGRAPG